MSDADEIVLEQDDVEKPWPSRTTAHCSHGRILIRHQYFEDGTWWTWQDEGASFPADAVDKLLEAWGEAAALEQERDALREALEVAATALREALYACHENGFFIPDDHGEKAYGKPLRKARAALAGATPSDPALAEVRRIYREWRDGDLYPDGTVEALDCIRTALGEPTPSDPADS